MQLTKKGDRSIISFFLSRSMLFIAYNITSNSLLSLYHIRKNALWKFCSRFDDTM